MTAEEDTPMKNLIAQVRADMKKDTTDWKNLHEAAAEMFFTLVEAGRTGEEIAAIGYFLHRMGDGLSTGAMVAVAVRMTMTPFSGEKNENPNQSYG